MKCQKNNSKGLENKFLGRPVSAEAVFGNEDLLYEILIRVPAKSLVRFKCVSKYWLGLISDQNFCYNHTTQNRESISALYFALGSSAYDELKSVSLRGHRNLPTLSFLSGIESNHNIRIRHTCNGLTLCTFGCPNRFIVCNLTTQKYRIICPPKHMNGFINVCSLAYDPSVSPYYKILSFGYVGVDSNLIDIYTSDESLWTRFNAPELEETPMNFTAFFNGSVHWMSRNYYFCFEVETMKLRKTQMPPESRFLHDEYRNKFFGECGGNLLLVQYGTRFVVRHKILQMEMEANRWILKQHISLGNIPEAIPVKRIRFNLLTILKGSHECDIIPVLLTYEGKVLAFYPSCKKIETICDFPDEISCLKYLQIGGAYQHFESLAPV